MRWQLSFLIFAWVDKGRGRVSARRPRYFSLLRQRKVPKRKATPLAVSLRFAAGNLRCSRERRCRRTRCARAALRSDNCGKSEHEAWASFGAPARLTRCASRHVQRGGEPTRANAALGPEIDRHCHSRTPARRQDLFPKTRKAAEQAKTQTSTPKVIASRSHLPKIPKAAEQAMSANAVAGPVPATGVVPPPEARSAKREGGRRRRRLRGVSHSSRCPADRPARWFPASGRA